MRTVLIFASFLAYTFIVGSLLSYPVWLLVQEIDWEPLNKPFGKIANRSFMLAAAIGIYPMLKAMNCFTQKDLGYDISKKDFAKQAGKGLSFGLFSLMVLAVALIVLNIRFIEDDATAGKAIGAVLKMIPGALVIAFLEETFFRGIILNSMSRTLKPFLAIVISSFVFATVHFLRNKTDGALEEIHWYSGFTYLMTTLANYTDPNFVGSWLTLFACGVFLSFLSLHYGNIAMSIGVHCGWVLVIRGLKKVSDDTPVEQSSLRWMIGSYDKVTGYLAFIIISLICLAYWFFFMRAKKPSES